MRFVLFAHERTNFLLFDGVNFEEAVKTFKYR
jgi:hypothetical protein